MLKGIDVNQRIEFTASTDITDPKTVFVLRPLTYAEMIDFSEKAGANKMDQVVSLLEKCIVEIRNYSIGENVLNLDESDSKKDALASLPLNVINELSVKLTELNSLTDIERKNS